MIPSTEAGSLDTLAKSKVSTMEAAVLTAPGKFEIKKVNIPEPEEGQVRIKIEGCGLCASSIPLWEGRDWFQYPIAGGNPGHEGWGIIDKVGTGVTDLKPGEKVAFISYHSFAEYDIAEAKAVLKIPSELKDQPFPGEPLGCAMNIFKRSDIKEGQTVAIIGIGFLGALLIQLCKRAGAKVIALSKREFSLEVAKKCGADHVVPLDDHWKIIEEVKKLTNGKFCERVIEATGKEWPLNLAGELTAEREKLIIAGFHQDGMRQVNVQLWNWRGLDVINAHERDPQMYINGIKEALLAQSKNIIRPSDLYTHTFQLNEINQAFNMLTQRPDGFVKALIKL